MANKPHSYDHSGFLARLSPGATVFGAMIAMTMLAGVMLVARDVTRDAMAEPRIETAQH